MNRLSLYQEYKNLENLYREIATKSWDDEYENFVLENIDKLNVQYLSGNPNILRISQALGTNNGFYFSISKGNTE